MVKLIATKPFRYAGILHAVGTEFEVEDAHAHIVVGIGSAKYRDEVQTDKPRRTYRRRDMTPDRAA